MERIEHTDFSFTGLSISSELMALLFEGTEIGCPVAERELAAAEGTERVEIQDRGQRLRSCHGVVPPVP